MHLAFIFIATGFFLSVSQAASPIIKIPNQLNYWKNAGFQSMVGALRLPTDSSQTDTTEVWLKIPDQGKVSVKKINDGVTTRYTLVFPPNTVADRVEYELGYDSVDDVRGARIDEKGITQFHVYETVPGQEKLLQGYEWARKDDATDVVVGNALANLYQLSGPSRDNFQAHMKCTSCHLENTPMPLNLNHPFRYESDSRGFFQPMAALQDVMTVRNSRDWDLNGKDPFISIWCGSVQTQVIQSSDQSYYTCPNQIAPTGKIDLMRALAAKDSHALAVCNSRSYLFLHMDAEARAAFATAFSECGLRN